MTGWSEIADDEYELVMLHGRPRYVVRGRCPIREDHMPHIYCDRDLGPFWCHASTDVRDL